MSQPMRRLERGYGVSGRYGAANGRAESHPCAIAGRPASLCMQIFDGCA